MDTDIPRRGAPSSARKLNLDLRADRPRLLRALHPLSAPPQGDGWNLEEFQDLVPGSRFQRQAAVLVGLMPDDAGARVLLTLRTDRLRQHGGQVSFPGGRIEAGDGDALTAALREAHEEIGLNPVQVDALGYLDPMVTISGYRVLPAVGFIDPGFVARPEPGEVAEVFDVPLDFLMAPESLETLRVDHAGKTRQVLQFRHDQLVTRHRIWGVTASILFNLRQRLISAGVLP